MRMSVNGRFRARRFLYSGLQQAGGAGGTKAGAGHPGLDRSVLPLGVVGAPMPRDKMPDQIVARRGLADTAETRAVL